MDLKTFMAEMPKEQREQLARELETTVDYLQFQIGGGHRQASPQLAKRIEEATRGIVKRHDLRPDIFEAA